MMNIEMAKVMVGIVGASSAAKAGEEADDAELAQAALAKAGAWSPLRRVLAGWHWMRGHIAPATGTRTADAAFAATAIAVVQGVMPSQPVPEEGLKPEQAIITDRASTV